MEYKSLTSISNNLGIKYSQLKEILLEEGYLTYKNDHSKTVKASNKAMDEQVAINGKFFNGFVTKFTPKCDEEWVNEFVDRKNREEGVTEMIEDSNPLANTK